MNSLTLLTHLSVGSILVILTGCNYTTQTTSGNDYLSQYSTGSAVGSSEIDEEVRKIASVEPNLHFPARIGLVKLYNGKMMNLSAQEAEAWTELKTELGSEFGEFVPVSHLVAESVYARPHATNQVDHASELIRKVRLGSARQHLDVVLIYEVFSTSKSTANLQSAVADLTIIGGYFIPTREIETTGYANCILMDVRSGYPYGTASASLTAEDTATTLGTYSRELKLEDKNKIETALKLIPEVKQMMLQLKKELG